MIEGGVSLSGLTGRIAGSADLALNHHVGAWSDRLHLTRVVMNLRVITATIELMIAHFTTEVRRTHFLLVESDAMSPPASPQRDRVEAGTMCLHHLGCRETCSCPLMALRVFLHIRCKTPITDGLTLPMIRSRRGREVWFLQFDITPHYLTRPQALLLIVEIPSVESPQKCTHNNMCLKQLRQHQLPGLAFTPFTQAACQT
jgi:hypothetical protein